MGTDWRNVVSPAAFSRLARKYREKSRFGVALIEAGLPALNRCTYYPWGEAKGLGLNLAQMVQESLRWGEPSIGLDREGRYVWGVPVCLNGAVVAGLFSAAHAPRAAEERGSLVSQAAWLLLELGVAANFCNGSLMQVNREQARASAYKAEAIHTVKRNLFQDSREIYLQEEFGLLSAIRQGQKERARSIINRILIRIYSLQSEDLELLKTLVLEMVVLMYRTAVDKGADPRELLGVNSSYLKEFHEIQDDVSLSQWLTRWLEDFISISLSHVAPAPPDSVALALEYIKNNLDQPITRDDVARACHMSYAHFSRVFRQRTGRTFSDLLNDFRVQKASALLDDSSLSIKQIALECGFADQSYFSKVFRRYAGATPKQHRRRAAGSRSR